MKEELKEKGLSKQWIWRLLGTKLEMSERTFYLHFQDDFKKHPQETEIKQLVKKVLNKYNEFEKALN